MIKYSLLGTIVFLMFCSALPLRQKEKKPAPPLKTYYLALLRSGSHRGQDSLTAAKIQEAHLANIKRLYDEGKLDIAGPFLDNGELRGLFIFNVASMEEAKKLADSDPAVQAGRLILELHPWMSQPGATLR